MMKMKEIGRKCKNEKNDKWMNKKQNKLHRTGRQKLSKNGKRERMKIKTNVRKGERRKKLDLNALTKCL